MHDSICYQRFPLAGLDGMSAVTARSFPRHTHDQYGIGVVDAGGHASWSGRGAVEAGPGHFICVNPGEVHDGRAMDHGGRSWRILYFDPTLMSNLATDVLEHLSATWLFDAPVFADGALRGLFEDVFAHAGTGLDCAMACETSLLKMVAQLGAHSTAAKPLNVASPGVRRARQRIDDDPAAAVSLAELARLTGLSRYQLIRGFTRELGLPPHAYLVQRRLALARRLVRAGRPLAEVAADSGFCDQGHLTRCFARQFGVPPKRYARAG